MVIGSQIAENSFWYDHGVELGAAIVTFLAFVLSFINIRRTDKRLEDDERKRAEKEERESQEKNEKTLKLIDLATYNERMVIQQWSCFFKKENDVTAREKYHILVSTHINEETENKQAFIVGEIANKYKFADLENELINFLEIIKENLNNNHINLNLQSLDRINNKISDLNEAINKSKQFKDIGKIINTIMADLVMPPGSHSEIEKQYKAYKNFSELLKKVSKSLLE